MDISIIPGATCAVIRIKINAYVNDTLTKWRLGYKIYSASTYTYTEEMYCEEGNNITGNLYGYGPLFYDLDGLQPNTKYKIKLQVTEGDESIENLETPVKTFTTCPEVSEQNQFTLDITSTSGCPDETTFRNKVSSFIDCMRAVGYDYTVTNTRSKTPMTNTGGKFKTSIQYGGNSAGSGADTSFKGVIHMGSQYENLSAYVHEYRHFLGLSEQPDNVRGYHGDDYCGMGFSRRNNYYPEEYPYYQNICKVAGFSRGIDDGSMEIYMFNSENSVDSKYIPREKNSSSSRKILLGFFLLKALGLNDITIVY